MKKEEWEMYSLGDSFIRINKELLKRFGIERAMYISNLVNACFNSADKNGWFSMSMETEMNNTTLRYSAIIDCRQYFLDFKVITAKKVGSPCRVYYKIDFDKLRDMVMEVWGL